jgi:hypothetical protein
LSDKLVEKFKEFELEREKEDTCAFLDCSEPLIKEKRLALWK